MMFCDHSLNAYKWRTKKLKEGRHQALNPDTNSSMLCLKSEICYIINSSMNFFLYHAYNEVIWSFFQIQNKWRTRDSKEGGYGFLNPDMNTSMLRLKSKIWFIHQFFNDFYLYHADNVVLWSFFQIQNNWRPRKLKQGRDEALNLDTNTSM